MTTQLAVLDIDGVLADVSHRLHHVATSPKDWGSFFAAAPDDPPLAEGLATARRLAEAFDIVYLSGRPEHCRRDTEAWLDRHELPPGRLLLRPEGDRRPARLVKVAALRRLSREGEVVVLVDDDEEVCAAARDAGYDVLPARWMASAPEADRALRAAQERDGRT